MAKHKNQVPTTGPVLNRYKVSELRPRFIKLGEVNLARSGNAAAWSEAAVIASLLAKGWRPDLGSQPVARWGDPVPMKANRRLSALVALAARPNVALPGPDGKAIPVQDVEIEILEYPASMTDEERNRMVAEEFDSTEVLTKADLVHLVSVVALPLLDTKSGTGPEGFQARVAAAVGLRTCQKFGVFREGVLKQNPDGTLYIDPTVKNAKMFVAKDEIMAGINLAKIQRAIPELATAYLEGKDLKKLNYEDLRNMLALWEQDKLEAAQKSTACGVAVASAATLKDLAAAYPDSKLCATFGPILRDGRKRGAGAEVGGARILTLAQRKTLVDTIKSPLAFALNSAFLGEPGADAGETNWQLLVSLFRSATFDAAKLDAWQKAVDVAKAANAKKIADGK